LQIVSDFHIDVAPVKKIAIRGYGNENVDFDGALVAELEA
jgi:hypothetical protein